MKKAEEIYVDCKARTVLECPVCGATTYMKVGIDTRRKRCNQELL